MATWKDCFQDQELAFAQWADWLSTVASKVVCNCPFDGLLILEFSEQDLGDSLCWQIWQSSFSRSAINAEQIGLIVPAGWNCAGFCR